VHPEYQANHRNHSFVVGWDKLSRWSPLVKGHPSQPHPGGYSDYPYFGCSTNYQVMRPTLDFYFFWNKLKKSIYYNLVSVATNLSQFPSRSFSLLWTFLDYSRLIIPNHCHFEFLSSLIIVISNICHSKHLSVAFPLQPLVFVIKKTRLTHWGICIFILFANGF
jgi:hypothetical protein